MLLIYALLIYFVVLIIAFALFYWVGRICLWSAVAMSVTLSLIIMMLCYPPLMLIAEAPGWEVILYGVIILITIIIIIFYIFSKGLMDRRHNRC